MIILVAMEMVMIVMMMSSRDGVVDDDDDDTEGVSMLNILSTMSLNKIL